MYTKQICKDFQQTCHPTNLYTKIKPVLHLKIKSGSYTTTTCIHKSQKNVKIGLFAILMKTTGGLNVHLNTITFLDASHFRAHSVWNSESHL